MSSECFNFHGWVGRTGLDWIIVCLVEIGRWNFSKLLFFFFPKWLHENLKTLKITPISNKGGLFVEISGHHNGARRGCLQVPVGVKIGDWACEFFWVGERGTMWLFIGSRMS